MSLEIWPSLSAAELKAASATTQERELRWQLKELGGTLRDLKHNLEDCYHLLAPAGRGNTLVVSTPRNETVKGHITRLGTQVVKGIIHLRLRTLPPQTLTIDPEHPITIPPLESLNTLLLRSIELLTLTLAYVYPSPESSPLDGEDPLPPLHGRPDAFLAAQLRVLGQAFHDASVLLKGQPLALADPAWTTCSAAPAHFVPPLPPAISFYIGLQDSQLVLWLRSLEASDVPVNLGMKFALALGTTRRLEHDEADRVFTYCCEDGSARGLHAPSAPGVAALDAKKHSTGPADSATEGPADVYVREKIRVESADPSLLSLSAKLNALGNSLLLARRNLAAVMNEELDD
ncbi:37S ribosomal protein rsm22 [Niveomyces insectorum RCEF 264]|uniref:37S ribosomal protein rsm22 n=1 Tax=Niveomyces insectorum RCEF 264 TaxID=1081102 RepID=A0A167T662_9HYPO|nr:37S ribosomal protein rsm22 [Niveomyces insectorum RCEF 264]